MTTGNNGDKPTDVTHINFEGEQDDVIELSKQLTLGKVDGLGPFEFVAVGERDKVGTIAFTINGVATLRTEL